MQKDIILFGIQGAGKGTQAKLLLEKKLLNYKVFESGQIFRGLTSNNNAIGSMLKDIMNSGSLVDNNVLYKLFEIFMSLVGRDTSVISDGFPRNLSQMYYFLNQMSVLGNRNFIGVFFDLPRDIALERLLKRSREEGRLDDTPEAIEKRLDSYEKETLPVIEYLESIGKIIRIDANKSIDDVFSDTCFALEL